MDISIQIKVHSNPEYPDWASVAALTAEQVRRNFSLDNELNENFEDAISYTKEILESALDLFHLVVPDNSYLCLFDEEREDGGFEVGICVLNKDFEETDRITSICFY